MEGTILLLASLSFSHSHLCSTIVIEFSDSSSPVIYVDGCASFHGSNLTLVLQCNLLHASSFPAKSDVLSAAAQQSYDIVRTPCLESYFDNVKVVWMS